MLGVIGIPHASDSALLHVRLRDALRQFITSTLAQHFSFPFVDFPKKNKKKRASAKPAPFLGFGF
jgi:hypothetical protein